MLLKNLPQNRLLNESSIDLKRTGESAKREIRNKAALNCIAFIVHEAEEKGSARDLFDGLSIREERLRDKCASNISRKIRSFSPSPRGERLGEKHELGTTKLQRSEGKQTRTRYF